MTYEQRHAQQHAQRQEQPRQHPRRATAALAAIGAIALFALQGCTSYVSSGLADDGKSAATLVWPDIETQASLNSRKEGSFPNRDNLRAIGPGATKDQLYELIGRPHFAEGMAGGREWDYVFQFRSGGGITPCRYKVIFDTNYRAQGFYWNPAACAKLAAQGG